jgi:hypothetical protein
MKLTGENRSTRGKNLSQCHFVHHKSHMDCPRIEPGPPRWEAGDYPPEPWHGPKSFRRIRNFRPACIAGNPLLSALQDGSFGITPFNSWDRKPLTGSEFLLNPLTWLSKATLTLGIINIGHQSRNNCTWTRGEILMTERDDAPSLTHVCV